MSVNLEMVISGGQTGADRAALDAAEEMGIETGGWIPKGRRAEDGRIPDKYITLKECDSANYETRTALNVRDSDGTLVISRGALSGGSKLTLELAERYGRPVLHVDLSTGSDGDPASRICDWLGSCDCRVLNVAGPRASSDPLIYPSVRGLVIDLLRRSGR